jgi:hypothetical protein
MLRHEPKALGETHKVWVIIHDLLIGKPEVPNEQHDISTGRITDELWNLIFFVTLVFHCEEINPQTADSCLSG